MLFYHYKRIRASPCDDALILNNLDINLAGQILPLITAENLSVRLAILLRFLETDGKFEVQLMPPQF